LNKIKDEAKAAAIAEHNRKNQQLKISQKEGDLDVMIKKTNKVALQAIQKELSLEELIRQEEEERTKAEEEQIRKQIEAEKKKKNCVLKAILEKRRENQYSLKTLEAQQRIENIKKDCAFQVLARRNKLKALLTKIREQSMLKKSLLKQELMDVKSSIANEIGKAYKKGNTNTCIEAMKSEVSKNNYCVVLYPDDSSMFTFCKKTADFCNFCCNAEFGDMFQTEKENCLSKTCRKEGDKK